MPAANCHRQNRKVLRIIAFKGLFTDIREFNTSSHLFDKEKSTMLQKTAFRYSQTESP